MPRPDRGLALHLRQAMPRPAGGEQDRAAPRALPRSSLMTDARSTGDGGQDTAAGTAASRCQCSLPSSFRGPCSLAALQATSYATSDSSDRESRAIYTGLTFSGIRVGFTMASKVLVPKFLMPSPALTVSLENLRRFSPCTIVAVASCRLQDVGKF